MNKRFGQGFTWCKTSRIREFYQLGIGSELEQVIRSHICWLDSFFYCGGASGNIMTLQLTSRTSLVLSLSKKFNQKNVYVYGICMCVNHIFRKG